MIQHVKFAGFIRYLRHIFAASVIVAVTLISLAWWSLPLLERYRSEVEILMSEALDVPVKIDEIDTMWSGLDPVIVMRGVYLARDSMAAGERAGLELEELQVSLDILASISSLSLRAASAQLVVKYLEVHRLANGELMLGSGQQAGSDILEAGPSGLIHWLGQSDVRVVARKVVFKDQLQKIPDVCVERTDITAYREAGELVVQLDAMVCNIAQSVRLVTNLSVDGLRHHQLTGHTYIELQQLSFPFWQQYLQDYLVLPDKGHIEFKAEFDLVSNQLHDLRGRMQVRQFTYDVGEEYTVHQLADMSANFHWYKTDEGWSFQSVDWQLQQGGNSWPVGDFTVDFLQDTRRLNVKSRYLRLDDISSILLRQPAIRSWIPGEYHDVKPAGVIRDVELELTLSEENNFADYTLKGRLENIALDALGEGLALGGIDGYMIATSRGGLLSLDTEQGSLDLQNLFRYPLHFSELRGILNWSILDSGIFLESGSIAANNAHISTTSRLSIHFPDNGVPFLDIQTDFKQGDGAYASLYMPATIMPQKAVEWLDKSIVAGDVEYGTFTIRGRIDEFPYDQGEGRFEVRFKVRNGVLDYYKDWPGLDEIEAEVVFQGRSMLIDATHAKLFGSETVKAHIEIPDLRQSSDRVLRISGSNRITSSGLMRYLHETGLMGNYREIFSVLELQGNHRLNLDLTVPLSAGKVLFNGDLDFQGNMLLASKYNISMQDIRGVLYFNEKSFSAEYLTAEYLGRPVNAGVVTTYPLSGRKTSIQVDTYVDVADLLHSQELSVGHFIKGDIDISATIDISDALDFPSRFTLRSDLQGAYVDLPYPFHKVAEDKWPFELTTKFDRQSGGEILIDIDQRIYAALDLDKSEGVSRAYVGFGKQYSGQLDVEGLFIDGTLTDVKVDKWLAWLSDRVPAIAINDLPITAELNLQHTQYGSHYIRDMTMNLLTDDRGWRMSLDGDATGELLYRQQPGSRHLDVRLSSLKIEKLSAEQQAGNEGYSAGKLKPADVPTLDLSISRLLYEGAEIGELNVETRRETDNLVLSFGKLENEDAEFNVTGGWFLLADDQHQTQLDIELRSDNFEDLIRRFGFNSTLNKGMLKMNVAVTAEKSPVIVTIADWQGELDINLRDGAIPEVDPGGAGRIFGLLSFHTLSRRLLLDFTDLFGSGMSFDEISGHFSVSDGQAYTNNLTMQAPSSVVEVSGRVGLKDEDYDQIVRVIPNLSSSLPVVGALAGGPGLAAAMLITHQFFGKPINKITELEYEVTGTWSEPQVKVSKAQIKELGSDS